MKKPEIPNYWRTWCEIDLQALTQNLQTLQKWVQKQRSRSGLPGMNALDIYPVVKANAYGHGMKIIAKHLEAIGADGLCVDGLGEAIQLRKWGIALPIHIIGHIPPEHAEMLAHLDRCEVVVYHPLQVQAFAKAAARNQKSIPVHVKLETGYHRQGLYPREAWSLIQEIDGLQGVHLAGISTHFAESEVWDEAETLTRSQIEHFWDFVHRFHLDQRNLTFSLANSGAAWLWPEAYGTRIRLGLSLYGMWPSPRIPLQLQKWGDLPTLSPILHWRTQLAQVRKLPSGWKNIGYNQGYTTYEEKVLGILPVGYYDGLDRKLSNRGHVLIRGQRAPILGRICMNMTIVDLTHIPNAKMGDVVTLLGRDGTQSICAEAWAQWIGTIHYEVTTRIGEAIPRVPK